MGVDSLDLLPIARFGRTMGICDSTPELQITSDLKLKASARCVSSENSCPKNVSSHT